jgi:hypothetical protein
MPRSKKAVTRAAKAAAKAAKHSDLALGGVTRIFEVPTGGSFDVEVWLLHDNPKWSVAIGGTTDAGAPFERSIGKDGPHFKTTVAGVPRGHYVITMAATLVNPGSQFTLVATSSIDTERVDLRPLPGSPTRLDMLPTRVG